MGEARCDSALDGVRCELIAGHPGLHCHTHGDTLWKDPRVTPPPTDPVIVCAHGALARSCDRCEMQAEIAALRSQLAEAQREIAEREGLRISGEAAIAQYVARAEAAEQQIAALREAAQTIHDTFAADEARGYRSRDRRYAIELLAKVLTGGNQG